MIIFESKLQRIIQEELAATLYEVSPTADAPKTPAKKKKKEREETTTVTGDREAARRADQLESAPHQMSPKDKAKAEKEKKDRENILQKHEPAGSPFIGPGGTIIKGGTKAAVKAAKAAKVAKTAKKEARAAAAKKATKRMGKPIGPQDVKKSKAHRTPGQQKKAKEQSRAESLALLQKIRQTKKGTKKQQESLQRIIQEELEDLIDEVSSGDIPYRDRSGKPRKSGGATAPRSEDDMDDWEKIKKERDKNNPIKKLLQLAKATPKQIKRPRSKPKGKRPADVLARVDPTLTTHGPRKKSRLNLRRDKHGNLVQKGKGKKYITQKESLQRIIQEEHDILLNEGLGALRRFLSMGGDIRRLLSKVPRPIARFAGKPPFRKPGHMPVRVPAAKAPLIQSYADFYKLRDATAALEARAAVDTTTANKVKAAKQAMRWWLLDRQADNVARWGPNQRGSSVMPVPDPPGLSLQLTQTPGDWTNLAVEDRINIVKGLNLTAEDLKKDYDLDYIFRDLEPAHRSAVIDRVKPPLDVAPRGAGEAIPSVGPGFPPPKEGIRPPSLTPPAKELDWTEWWKQRYLEKD